VVRFARARGTGRSVHVELRFHRIGVSGAPIGPLFVGISPLGWSGIRHRLIQRVACPSCQRGARNVRPHRGRPEWFRDRNAGLRLLILDAARQRDGRETPKTTGIAMAIAR
jgi:hypothetical protein